MKTQVLIFPECTGDALRNSSLFLLCSHWSHIHAHSEPNQCGFISCRRWAVLYGTEEKRSSVNKSHLLTKVAGTGVPAVPWCSPIQFTASCPMDRMVLASLPTGKTLLIAQEPMHHSLFRKQAIMGEGLALFGWRKVGREWQVRTLLLWIPVTSQNHEMLQCFL